MRLYHSPIYYGRPFASFTIIGELPQWVVVRPSEKIKLVLSILLGEVLMFKRFAWCIATIRL